MKVAIMSDKRWLSIMIGGFGCVCLARAAVFSYYFYSFTADKHNRYMSYDMIIKFKNMQDLMVVSIIAFTLIALVSIVSAIGIFLNKAWAAIIWLFATLFIFLYLVFVFYNDPRIDDLAVLVLCLYSWVILWYRQRKQTVAIP
jgi:hypothetical protein